MHPHTASYSYPEYTSPSQGQHPTDVTFAQSPSYHHSPQSPSAYQQGSQFYRGSPPFPTSGSQSFQQPLTPPSSSRRASIGGQPSYNHSTSPGNGRAEPMNDIRYPSTPGHFRYPTSSPTYPNSQQQSQSTSPHASQLASHPSYPSHSRHSSLSHQAGYHSSQFPPPIPENSAYQGLSPSPFTSSSSHHTLPPIQTENIHNGGGSSTLSSPSSGSYHHSRSSSHTSLNSPTTDRYICETCGKTFTRSHDRKRHYETHHQPNPIIHRCRGCEKGFSRADSLKRHIDNNGCQDPRM